jgi:ABC-type transporter MlaC component
VHGRRPGNENARGASTPRAQHPACIVQAVGAEIVATYSDGLSEYVADGAVPRVIGSRLDPDGAIVSSEFNRGSGPSTAGAIRVDWRLTRHHVMYKVTDIIIDGLSMAVNGRSELEGVAERNGGQAWAILAVIRQETASALLR